MTFEAVVVAGMALLVLLSLAFQFSVNGHRRPFRHTAVAALLYVAFALLLFIGSEVLG